MKLQIHSALIAIVSSAIWLTCCPNGSAVDIVNPPVEYCCDCLPAEEDPEAKVSVKQTETATAVVLMDWTSIEASDVVIRKDNAGYYNLEFRVSNDCDSGPTVVLTDQTPQRWEAQCQPHADEGDEDGEDDEADWASFSLAAHQVSLPINIQIYCPGASVCATGRLVGDCTSCESACPIASGEVTGGVDSSGAGGSEGEYNGSFNLGTSSHGDMTTGMTFAINPANDLAISDFHLVSSGGYTLPGGGSVQTDTTLTTIVASGSSITVKTFLRVDGSPENDPFRTLLFENLSGDALKVTVTDHVNASSYWQKWRHPSALEWQYLTGSGMRRLVLTRDTSVAAKPEDRLKVYERPAADTSGEVAAVAANKISDVSMKYQLFGTQWKKIKEVIDPSGANLTTKWDYWEAGVPTGTDYAGTGFLKSVEHYNGQKELHFYDSTSHIVNTFFAGLATTHQRITSWNATDKIQTITETVGGTLISMKEVDRSNLNKVIEKLYTGGENFLTTTTCYDNLGGDFGGRPTKVTYPDDTIAKWDYSRVAGPSRKIVTMERGAGTTAVSEGTSTVTKYSALGQIVSIKTTAIGSGSGTILEEMKVNTADQFDRPLTVHYFPVAGNPTWTEEFAYSCCGVSQEKDKYGIITTHGYDDLKRRISSTRLGITTATVFDRLTTSTHRIAGAGTPATENEISRSVRSLGTTTHESWQRSPHPLSDAMVMMTSTSTIYRNPVAVANNPNPNSLPDNIGWKTQTTWIEVSDDSAAPKQYSLYYPDGKMYRTWGDMALAENHAYTATSTSTSSIEGAVDVAGTGGTPRETRNVFQDLAGRITQTTGRDGQTDYFHNALGQLERVQDPDGVNTRYAYNSKGERTTTAIKRNNTTGSITYGTDSVTRTETKPAARTDGTMVLRTQTYVWKDGNTSSTTGTWVSTTDRTPAGLHSWASTLGVSGEASSTVTLSGSGDWTETTIKHDQSKTITAYDGGLWDSTEEKTSANALVSSTSARTAADALGYDGFKRLTHTKDSRTGVTVTGYRSDTSDAVVSITPPAGVSQKTTFTYDHRGRRIQVDAPQSVDANNASLDNITNTTYWPDGSVNIVSGGQTYPVSYTYDYAGRKLTMTTSSDSAAGDATTKWIYSPTTGRLTDKKYNYIDGDNPGSGPSYTYTNAGRPQTRSWVREVSTGVRVKATYVHTYGLLTSITYNDGTPEIAYSYDAFSTDNNHIPGDLETVTRDGRTWTYKYDGTTLRPLSETQPLGGTAITRVLTRSFDTHGRPDGFLLGTTADADIDHAASYEFDTAGRYNVVSAAGKVFDYTYTTNSRHLIDTVAGPVDMLVTNTWENDRDALHVKQNKVATTTVSQFTYGVNDLGQREGVTTTGTAFGGANRGWAWGYDGLGQATKAINAANTDLNRAYVFDNIGNRTSATDGIGDTSTTVGYTPNALNQYATIDPGTAVNPDFDSDGNLKADAGINAMGYGLKYDWDAENRITVVKKADNTQLTTYVYDHMGRRIRKTTTSAAYQGASDTAYFYDGFNVVAEYTLTGEGSVATLLQAYTWGLDLSGTLQGAGGVGGLLCIHRVPGTDTSGNRTWTDTFYPNFDGNGNVSEYLDKTGAAAAHFEYDPFGRVVHQTGTPQFFTYRFSTKPQDFETGLYYYTYRYYDPVTGRWPSRDPIEERGGLNLYGFVGNNGINRSDLLGQRYEACPEGECCIDGQCTRCPKTPSEVEVMAGAGGLLRWEKIGVAGLLGSFTIGLSINQIAVCLRACEELTGVGDEIIIKTRLNHLMDGVLGPLMDGFIYTRVFIDEEGKCDYEYVVGKPHGGVGA